MADKLWLIKMPEDAIEKSEDYNAINLTPTQMADILFDAKPVEELHSWADICKEGQLYAVKERK